MTSGSPGRPGGAIDPLAAAGGPVPPVPRDIALVGGGRWARVWYRVLSSLQPQPHIRWVSSRNPDGVAAWLAAEGALAPVRICHRLDLLFDGQAPPVAIVANLPSEHGSTARTLLERGCHVLVEKPLVPTEAEARALVELADRQGLVLAVGLELMLATYVARLREAVAAHQLEPVSADIVWHDVYEEVRAATLKTPDLTTGVAADLLPHVLSLLTALRGPAPVDVETAAPARGGLEAEIRLRYGGLPVAVSLARAADRPARLVRLQAASGATCSLDFTKEPGTVIIPDGRTVPDDRWAAEPRPLAALIRLFLSAVAQRGGEAPILASRTLHIVHGTEAAASLMLEAQIARLRPYLLDEAESALPPDAHVALRELLAAPLVAEGVVANPKAEADLDRGTRLAWRVLHRFATHPFTTQPEMARALGVEAEPLARLNGALRRSDAAQALMVNHGVAMKYWANTILPLLQSGVFDEARRGVRRHPFRVGVYPGVSCMFFCSFCGRQRDARYAGDTVVPGNATFEAMFRHAPAGDPYTFYVSGGLEPLTNPAIGQLVASGAAHGFRLSMYTNGYMLTPQLLARQSGLWALDTLRISLYGVDQETTVEVTSHPKAHAQVVENAITFLRARNERGVPLKFGLNFVVLPGRVEQVLRLVELIASINRAAGSGRQVDFLTLREDYSVPPERGVGAEERRRLAEIFARLGERVARPDLCDLQIDFGYALHPLSQGGSATPLEMVEHTAMRPRGYPQISVVVDLLGDVYLYREAGFLERPGARRYAIGRVTPTHSLEDVVGDFLASGQMIAPEPGDTGFFDIFDHVVTHLLNQADEDEAFGIPFDRGPVRDRHRGGAHVAPLAHPTLAHPTLAHPTLVPHAAASTRP